MNTDKNKNVILGVALALMMLGAFWSFYFDPMTQTLQAMQARIESKRRELSQKQAMVRQLPVLEAELKELDRTFTAYMAAMASRAVTHGDALLAFKHLADQLGVEFESAQVMAKPQKLTETVSLYQYELSLKGMPARIYDFLTSIEEATWILRVKGGALTAERDRVHAALTVLLPRKEADDGSLASR